MACAETEVHPGKKRESAFPPVGWRDKQRRAQHTQSSSLLLGLLKKAQESDRARPGQLHRLTTCAVPQKGPTFALMLYCHHVEVPKNFS
jgi:hypothetical protein